MKTTIPSLLLWLLFLTNLPVAAQCPINLDLFSQSGVDNFATDYPECTQITGDVIIQGLNITSLDGLNGITHIGGRLQIIGTNLTNLDGLSSLVSIGTFIDLYLNNNLNDISGLENVVFAPSFSSIVLEANPNLSVCNVPNICRFFANPTGFSYVAGNAAGCATIPQIRSSCITPDANGILYVRKDAVGSGSSWNDALGEVSEAFAEAQTDLSITQIWVAKGTYSATGDGLRMRNNLEIYGGFDPDNGIDDLSNQRISPSATTGSILTGDNVRRVVTNIFTNTNPLNDTAVLNGFTITQGNPPHTAQQLDIADSGGGIINVYASPKLINLFIFDNYANDRGGGIYNNFSNPTIVNTVVARNSSQYSGGGIYNLSSPAKLINCTIAHNHSERVGGVRNNGTASQVVMKNCIVFGNTKTATDAENVNLSNIGNATITYQHTFVQNLTTADAEGNIAGTLDPLFVNPANNNFRLQRCSPMINSGNNLAFASGQTPDIAAVTIDLAGSPRIFNNQTVDLGAYEYQANHLQTQIVYVDADATGNNNGSSWENAYTDLQSGINAACVSDEVWVAEGEYQTALNQFFRMKEGVKIYGGFAGTETTLEARNWKSNVTVLKGNNNSVIRNEFTVSSPMTNASMLNGFTIKDGLANQSSDPENVLDAGGGIFNFYASPQLINLIITNNVADDRGGGIYNRVSNPVIVNSLISKNTANRSGGALYNFSSSPKIINTTIANNTADRVGGIRNNYAQSAVVLQNSIVYGNTQIQTTLPEQTNLSNLAGATINCFNSLIQNVTTADAQGNLSGTLDPLFMNVANNDYRLLSCSPLLNEGTNTVFDPAQTPDLTAITTDLAGNPRIQNTTVDLGAYETDNTTTSTILYVDGTATGNNDGTSWVNAYTSFAEAVITSDKCVAVNEIHVAEGTYYPEYATNLNNTTSSVRNRSFTFRRGGLEILGGYPSGGGTRNWKQHPTILSGNIGYPALDNDNAFHVVVTYGTAVDQTFKFDGFRITKANANNNTTSNVAGGGTVLNYEGGGWSNTLGSPAISNVIISGNSGMYASGFYNELGNPTLTNTVISGNNGDYGAGVYNRVGNPVFINCTISGNRALHEGGGIRIYNGNPVITNCIIFGNTASINAGIGILMGSPVISYSLIQGLSNTANGNLNGLTTNPQFVAPTLAAAAPTTSGNYALQGNSLAIDAANSTVIPTTITTDLDGNDRIIGLSADMGAFEYQGSFCPFITTWNGVAWSNGLPNEETKIIFNGDYTSDNSNSDAGTLEGCSVEIVSGDVVISEGHNLILNHEINTAGGSFVLKNNASLVQVEDEALNQGTLTSERITTPIYRYDYVYWSSPVTEDSGFLLGKDPANPTRPGLSSLTLFDKYHAWDTDLQEWSIIPNGNQVMLPGKGYIVRAPQSYGSDPQDPASYNNFTGNFIGKPNNGVVNTPIAGGLNQWNLIGNPYPSALYVDDFLYQNNTIVDGTIYIWTHSTAISNNGSGEVYNYDADDYATYNLSGAVGTGSGENSPNGGNVPTGYIASGQSFFIKGSPAGGLALFTNSMRVAGQNNQFFRPAVQSSDQSNSTEKHRIWLNLTGPQNAFKQTLVGYIENATNDLDWGYDGETFSSNSVSLYSLLDDVMLAIQGRSLPFDNQDQVPLGYKTGTAGTYTISIDHLDGLFDQQGIYLEDIVLNIVHDLKTSDYTFTTVSGTFNERFVLRYLASDLDNGGFEGLEQKVVIAKIENELVVKSFAEPLKEVAVYDLLGRTILHTTTIQNNEIRMADVVLNTQALIVKVTLENGMVVTRKVIY
ncbi:hypothetical protein J2X31_003035 [Flavobacterium arsenatis]|uniref:T9SS sorting signal type C domain-containing protein n=1 Tax=Flavobacterium arsenatis TaxID=1484332 RepID=A0ABU1TSZ4_9FLAO|nr:choice-of-anchor Q domain-containing protein [Flavobacterium arsenatis]MDR6969009.1 hypothetical protein [Flavobacterium arsenatis]